MTIDLRKRAPLPWFQRLLFGMILPLLAYYGAYVLLQERGHVPLQVFSMPAAGAAARDSVAQILRTYAPILGVTMALPMWFFVLIFTLRAWKHWYTAFVGGAAAIAAGITVTWLVTLLLVHLIR